MRQYSPRIRREPSSRHFGCGGVQRQIQRQNINPGLAEQSSHAALGVLRDQLADAIFRHLPRLRHARHLEQRRLRRDIGIEAAARGGDEIDGDGAPGIFGLQLVDVFLDPVVQRLAGRAEVGAAGIGGIIGRRHGLGGIGRVRRRGRRGPAMEIFVVLEFLPDQGGADHLAVLLDQAALRLLRKDHAGNRGHRERIGKAGDGGQQEQQDDGGANFVEAWCVSLEFVIARSEATKQSGLLLEDRMDCFASLLAMTV